MVSNQILQSTIDGLKNISRIDFCVTDSKGRILATTLTEKKNVENQARIFGESVADSQEMQGYQYFKIFDDDVLEYILVVCGTGENSYLVGKMASFQFKSLIVAYRERFDKDNFIKNLILDNFLLVDIFARAKKLKIKENAKRVVYMLETKKYRDKGLLEVTRNYFSHSFDDFVTAVDEESVIVIKELSSKNIEDETDEVAEKLLLMLKKEGFTDIRISFGSIISEIREVSRSYKEAKMALEVGRIFFEERNIIAYSELGIGRLIYHLPIPLCRMFIKEIFGENPPESFDEELLSTIFKFFENNLNVSETSRQLFIHRNTLVYRLDKLQKATGLDLRIFEDAITFKIALMVSKYMKYMESNEF